MIRFLIKFFVRRTWFGHFDELYFVLNWLVMRCKLRPELAADAQQTAWSLKSSHVKSIYFNHPSQGNSTNYYLILGPRYKAAPPISQQINKFPPKRVKNLTTPSSIFIFISSSSTGELCSQPIRGNVRWIGRSFLDPEYSLVAVRRILPTRFEEPTRFAEYSQLGSRTNIRPVKNGLKEEAMLC